MKTPPSPITGIALPLIAGITCAYLSSRFTYPYANVIMVANVLIGIALLPFLFRLHRQGPQHPTFNLATYLLFFLFGFFICTRNISKAITEYGTRWRYEYFVRSKPSDTIDSIQYRLHETYLAHGISGETGAVVEAMTIGRKKEMSKHTREAFANAGLSHILALSGFHISIIFICLQTSAEKQEIIRQMEICKPTVICCPALGICLHSRHATCHHKSRHDVHPDSPDAYLLV